MKTEIPLVGSRWTKKDEAWLESKGFKRTEDPDCFGEAHQPIRLQLSYVLGGEPQTEVFRNEENMYVATVTWSDDLYGKGVARTLKAALRKARADFNMALKNIRAMADEVFENLG